MSRKRVIVINLIAMFVGFMCFGYFLSNALSQLDFTIIFVILSLLNVCIASVPIRITIIENPKTVTCDYPAKQLTILVAVITLVIFVAMIITLIL